MQSRARMKSVSEPTSQSLRHRRRALAVALLGLVAISVTGCAGDSATEAAAWSPSGGPRGLVTGLAVSPAKPEIIYATVSDRGLFKSTDGGRSWRRPANTGLPPDLNVQGAPIVGKYSVCCVAVHPDVPMTVYAISGPSSEVVKSTDGGRRWRVTRNLTLSTAWPSTRRIRRSSTPSGGRVSSRPGMAAVTGETRVLVFPRMFSPQLRSIRSAPRGFPSAPRKGTYGRLGTAVALGDTRALRGTSTRCWHSRSTRTSQRRSTPEPTGPVSLRARTSIPGKLPTPVCRVRVIVRTMCCLCMRSR